MREIMIGALAMGYGVAGIFFLRFWRETGDRLFGFFALAFFVLAISRVGFALTTQSDHQSDYLYWVRLIAFTIILLAIADKNFMRRDGEKPL